MSGIDGDDLTLLVGGYLGFERMPAFLAGVQPPVLFRITGPGNRGFEAIDQEEVLLVWRPGWFAFAPMLLGIPAVRRASFFKNLNDCTKRVFAHIGRDSE